LASSIVSILRQSSVGGRRRLSRCCENVDPNKLGLRFSAFLSLLGGASRRLTIKQKPRRSLRPGFFFLSDFQIALSHALFEVSIDLAFIPRDCAPVWQDVEGFRKDATAYAVE
jgi:hypothetical protein